MFVVPAVCSDCGFYRFYRLESTDIYTGRSLSLSLSHTHNKLASALENPPLLPRRVHTATDVKRLPLTSQTHEAAGHQCHLCVGAGTDSANLPVYLCHTAPLPPSPPLSAALRHYPSNGGKSRARCQGHRAFPGPPSARQHRAHHPSLRFHPFLQQGRALLREQRPAHSHMHPRTSCST